MQALDLWRPAWATTLAILVVACGPTSAQRISADNFEQSEGHVPESATTSVSPEAPPKVAPGRNLCGVQIGEAIPADIEFEIVQVQSELDPIPVYKMKPCGDGATLTAELQLGRVSRLDLEGAGACATGIACVGETYEQVLSRFPSASRFASLIEGRSLALFIDDRTVVHFGASGLEDDCFDQPKSQPNKCESLFRERTVTAITLG